MCLLPWGRSRCTGTRLFPLALCAPGSPRPPPPQATRPRQEQQVTRSSERDSLIKGFIIKAHGFPGAAFLQPGRWALSLAGSLRLLGSGDKLQGSPPQEVSFPHEGPSEP